MPETSAQTFNLDTLSGAELEQRRRTIVETIRAFPKQWDDPQVPTDLLRELAQITGMLRRKTAGPPKVAKPSKRGGAPKPTVDDLSGLLT